LIHIQENSPPAIRQGRGSFLDRHAATEAAAARTGRFPVRMNRLGEHQAGTALSFRQLTSFL
jgi:hypothetical protein